MKHLLSFLVLMCVSLSAMASNTSVKNADGVDIWYDFDSSTNTASVTYKGNSYSSYNNEYTGEVVIPSTVTYKGEEYGVTSIGNSAFENCFKLYEVYNKSNLTITAGSSDNGRVACYAKNVYTDSEGESKFKTVGDYIFYVDGEDIEIIAYTGSETSITLPSDYEGKNYNIGDHAFAYCNTLTSITLPESVTSIGESAFSSCSALTSITLPEGVTSIGDYAFYYCDVLTSITLPEGVTSIGYDAFYNCYKLYEVYNKSNLTITAGSRDNGYVAYYAKNVYTDSEGESKLKTVGDYLFYADGEDIELIAYTGSETSITLPSDYEGKNYKIGYRAFYKCDALTSVTIPEGVTSIGDYAFYNCDALTSITLPKSLTSIGNSAFCNCDALTSVTIPEGVTSIGDNAFRNCDALTSITLPEGVTSIGNFAFHDCEALTSIILPKDLTSIGNYAFAFCYSLKSITLPEGVTSIGDNAFFSCWSLTSITLPEGVTSIGDNAFYYCKALTSITLPEGVTSIGDNAFYYCKTLTSITSKNATPPTIGGSYTFDYVGKSIPVYVPKSSVDAYKSAEYWKDFTNIVGKYYIVDIEAENGTVEGAGAYEENAEATLTATPAEGYKFVQWSDGVTDNPRTIVVVSDMTFTAEFELKEYTLTTEAENGTVEGAGIYKHGTEATLTVTPNEGYKFVQWSDGVTDNPRTIVVVSDMTFTADVQKCWTVYATAENGDISGVGVYFEGDEATLIVTPNEGYKFVQWSDGVTDNPRTIVVVSDMTFTAEFELKEYTLTTEAENGTVEGASIYKHGDEVTLTATPAEGYKFLQWSDGVTDNPRTVVVTSDTTFTADIQKSWTIYATAENGDISGVDVYFEGDEATLTVTPNEGYKFVQWSDGVTDNPRTVVVTSDLTFTAEFELKEYTLTTEAENGTVEGAGTYKHGDKATLSATPAEGYKFVQWSDGVTDNPRTIVVVSDMTFTAEFELKEYTLTTEAENGTVEGAGTYKHGDETTLTATPAEGYKFVQWSDGVTDNPRTVVVVSDMTFTAEFELKEYTLTTEAENGTVEGAGTYKHGAEVTLTATPNEGYKFVKWSDGVTDNSRTVVVVSDTTFTAEFEIDNTPISDIQTSDVNVRLIGNRVVVEGADDYTVYSISGQNLGKVESVERGIYIVVVNGKSFKVVAK